MYVVPPVFVYLLTSIGRETETVQGPHFPSIKRPLKASSHIPAAFVQFSDQHMFSNTILLLFIYYSKWLWLLHFTVSFVDVLNCVGLYPFNL